MENSELKNIWEKTSNGEVILIDTRIVNEYSRKHVPGSLCAPYSRSGWGTAVFRYLEGNKVDLAILASNEDIAAAARSEAEKEGLSVTAVISDSLERWESLNLPVASMWEITPEDLNEKLNDYVVIDVREPYEWQSGLIPGAMKVPMDNLPEKIGELPHEKRYAIVCNSGARSQSAALYMADSGFDAGNVIGGMSRWISRSLPVEYE